MMCSVGEALIMGIVHCLGLRGIGHLQVKV